MRERGNENVIHCENACLLLFFFYIRVTRNDGSERLFLRYVYFPFLYSDG